MSFLDEFDDSVFSEATSMVMHLSKTIESSAGRKPTVHEFCELLSVALQSTHVDVFEDVSPGAVSAIVPKLRGHPEKLPPGALIGIRSKSGRWHLVLYLTTNGFGHAFGVFRDRVSRLPPGKSWKPIPTGVPVYSQLKPVQEGRWRVVGARPELLRLFPSDPEIYHAKIHHPHNPDVGEFGSAETPSGKLRHVEKQEAIAVGLLTNEYQQCLLEEEFVSYLDRIKTARD